MKPAILIAAANDHDNQIGYLRELDREVQEVSKAFQQAGVLCEFLPPLVDATFAEIREVFRKYRNRIAVLHFAGHANGLSLFMKAAKGQEQVVRGENLAEFLASQDNLQLVFLNACSTGPQCEHFINAGVSSVISTSQEINDTVARQLSVEFYKSLARGASIQVAFREAVASSKPNNSNSPRGLYTKSKSGQRKALGRPQGREDWPWRIRYAPGAETTADWNLPDASGNPLFGTPELSKSIGMPNEPFKNLKRFEREDARIFFGRGYETRNLYNKVVDEAGAPIILYYGQSGVGKSSLLDAGLKPRLTRDFKVCYRRRDPEGIEETLRLSISSKLKPDELASAWVRAERSLRKRHGRDIPLVVILDQMEEMFTQPDTTQPDELPNFVRLLRQIFVLAKQRPKGKLILAFRKEWLAEVAKQLKEQKVPYTGLFLDRLGSRGIVEAVQLNPSVRKHFGLEVQTGLANRVATDLLSDPASPVAPTLQVLMAGLWTQVAKLPSRQLSEQLYDDSTRDGLSLDDFVSRELNRLQQRQPELMTSGLGLDVLNFHSTELGTAKTCTVDETKVAYGHQWDQVSVFLRQCVDSYLLIDVSEGEADQRAYRLAHDTLGPLVRRRFDDSDLPGQRARRILDARIQEWDGEKDGDPLDEFDLATVESGVQGMRQLHESELRLMLASEQERRRKQLARRRTRALGLGALLTIAVIGVIAWFAWQTAQTNNRLRLVEEQEKVRQQARNVNEQMEFLVREGTTARDLHQEYFHAIHEFVRAEKLFYEADDELLDTGLIEQRLSNNALMAAGLLLGQTKLVQAYQLKVPKDQVVSTVFPDVHLDLSKDESTLLVWSAYRGYGNDFVAAFDVQTGRALMEQLTSPNIVEAELSPDGSQFRIVSQGNGPAMLSIYQLPTTGGAAERIKFEKEMVGDTIFGPKHNQLIRWNGNRATLYEGELEIQTVPFPFQGENNKIQISLDENQRANLIGSVGGARYVVVCDVFGDFVIQDVAKDGLPYKFRFFEDQRRAVFWPTEDAMSAVQKILSSAPNLLNSVRDKLYEHETILTNTVRDGFVFDLVTHSFFKIKLPRESYAIAPATNRIVEWAWNSSKVRLKQISASNPNSGRKSRDIRCPTPSSQRGVIFDSRGERFATLAAQSNSVQIWDALFGYPISPVLTHPRKVSDARFLKSRNWVLTCSQDGTIRAWQLPKDDLHEWVPGEVIATEQTQPVKSERYGNKILTVEELVKRLPANVNSGQLVGGVTNDDETLLVYWDFSGIVRIWDLQKKQAISQPMYHQTEARSKGLSLGGAKLLFNDEVLVTWTYAPNVSGNEPVYFAPGQLRFWDAVSGEPISPIYFERNPYKLFDLDTDTFQLKFQRFSTSQGATEVRTLPYLAEFPCDPVKYAQLATGTRLNELGELEFLTVQEWQALKQEIGQNASEELEPAANESAPIEPVPESSNSPDAIPDDTHLDV